MPVLDDGIRQARRRRCHRRREDIAFGETLRVPEPFGFELVTGDLLPH
ncbi:hypothetical protein [Kitasatospora sp. NPDC098663]